MDLLREHGYTTVDLTGAILAIGSNAEQRFVAITVDDGYRDFYTHAAPMLAEHGFTATVFVVSDLTGDRTRKCLNGRECMTWREVREVHSCGMSVGSHTASHCQLYGMSLAAIDTELRQSRETLEDRLGEEIGSFAYPYAFPQQDRHFVTVIRHMLSACGYLNGVSTTIGTSSQRNDVYFLPRLPVNSHDDDRLFLAKIYGAYDWLRVPQGLYKHLKQVGRRCYEPTERCRGYVSS
jgi:peptidoglycan/xylan/chitin deacetylase (PgdA/CDA1 family)